MELKQAKDLLITFNRWRRGEDIEPPLDPHYIGKALDIAIQCLEDSIEGVKEAKEVKDKGCACYGNNKIHPCFCNPFQQKSKNKNK